MDDYQYTADWLSIHVNSWNAIFNHVKPKRILEIGSFEGRATCYMIENVVIDESTEIVCIDTWEGGEEHADLDMGAIEQRFDHNINLARANRPVKVRKIKSFSFPALTELYTTGHANYFDIVYVDGSHQATDVLNDLIFAYQLVRTGGVLILDDYVWRHQAGILHEPKTAIDAFSLIYREKISPIVDLPLRQVYFFKNG